MNRGLVIEAVTLLGDRVDRFELEHGMDPSEALLDRGWAMTGIVGAFSPPGEQGAVLRIAVVGALTAADVDDEGDFDQPLARVTRMDPSNPNEPVPAGASIHRHQRLSAYAVVLREDTVLLTQLSDKVAGGGAGLWTLPGGGVDPGEDPATGLRREVWEETGQHLGELDLLDLATSQWVGQAPSGGYEDYQTVRLIYLATVPHPGPLVVHDVGGTTSTAQWIAPADLPVEQRGALLVGGRWQEWLNSAVERATAGRRGRS